MIIDTKLENGNGILVPHGSIDSFTAGELEAAGNGLDFQALEGLALDLSDVDYISSKGLRVLVSMGKKLNGKPLEILGANAAVADIFHLSGLSRLFVLK